MSKRWQDAVDLELDVRCMPCECDAVDRSSRNEDGRKPPRAHVRSQIRQRVRREGEPLARHLTAHADLGYRRVAVEEVGDRAPVR